MAQAGIDVALLVDVLSVFIIAAGVGVFVAKVGRFPYTIALLLAGVAASVAGVGLDIDLSHDLILLVLLPPLLFEGAATTDLKRLRRNLVPILTLAVVGLLVSVLADEPERQHRDDQTDDRQREDRHEVAPQSLEVRCRRTLEQQRREQHEQDEVV